MEESRSSRPTPESPIADSAEPALNEKAGGPIRVLGFLAALVLGIGAGGLIAGAVDVSDTPTCPEAQAAGDVLLGDNDCVGEATTNTQGQILEASGSKAAKTVPLVLLFGAGVLGVLAALGGLVLAFTGRHGRLVVQLTILALAVGALAFLAGEVL